jgi:hypothetical protein
MTRSEAIAANIAKRIAASKTRLRFSTLHRLAIEETSMSNVTEQSNKPAITSDVKPAVNVGSQVVVGPVKQIGYTTLEGSHPGDHRPQAADAVLPEQKGPRA